MQTRAEAIRVQPAYPQEALLTLVPGRRGSCKRIRDLAFEARLLRSQVWGPAKANEPAEPSQTLHLDIGVFSFAGALFVGVNGNQNETPFGGGPFKQGSPKNEGR